MKKNLVKIIIIASVVAISLGVYSLQKDEKPVPDTTITPPVTEKTPPISEIDYSSLEKDRLYTEEEGKYANLSEIGKRLLREVLALPQCVDDISFGACYEYEKYTIMNSSIVAMKNNILLLDAPNGKGGMYYNFYDVAKKEAIGKSLHHYSDIRNNDFIIYIDQYSLQKEQTILYYKIGMSQFSPISKSTIYFDESYLYHVGMGLMNSTWSIVDNLLKITIFREQPTVASSLWPKIREVTFDLNTLP